MERPGPAVPEAGPGALLRLEGGLRRVATWLAYVAAAAAAAITLLGVYITMMIEISLIHPPLGVNLFILSAITRNEVPFGQIAWATVPYWLLMLVATALIAIFPQIVLFLPLGN